MSVLLEIPSPKSQVIGLSDVSPSKKMCGVRHPILHKILKLHLNFYNKVYQYDSLEPATNIVQVMSVRQKRCVVLDILSYTKS